MEKDFFDDIIVVKRSGQRVNFNDIKVAMAIKKSFDSVYEEYDEKEVNKVKEKVLDYIKKEYKDRKTIGVEDVSDAIEAILKKFMEEDMLHNNSDLYHLNQFYQLALLIFIVVNLLLMVIFEILVDNLLILLISIYLLFFHNTLYFLRIYLEHHR